MKVRDALVADPRVLAGDATVQEAAELLARPNVLAVLVVDGDRLLGCVTDAAVVAAAARGLDPATTPVREICETEVATVAPDTPLGEALHLMAEREVERLAVTEDGRLLGVLLREPAARRLAEDEPPETGLSEDRQPAA